MKTTLFLLFLMAFSSIPGLAQTSQIEYRPFAQDGKIWWYQVGATKENFYSNRIDGDTLIGGNSWKKVYNNDGKYFMNPTGDAGLSYYYYAAVRDVDKKVYAIAKGSNRPRLLYDFSLKKGDIVKCGMEGNSFSCLLEKDEQPDSLLGFEFLAYLKVERIDTITDGNQEYRAFILTLLDAYRQPMWDSEREKFVIGNVIWIEGVGSYIGPFSPWMQLSSHNNVSRSCRFDKTSIFIYPEFNEYYEDWEDWATDSDNCNNDIININQNGSFHNLQGFRMTRPSDRGIYIQNGKKFVAK